MSKKETALFLLGLMLVCAGLVPYLFLGERSIFAVVDQLDSDVAEYFIKAKHFGDGSKFLPEYFGGSSGNLVVPTSPGTLLFYVVFDVFHAFLYNLFCVTIAAYVGMFFLLRRILDRPFVAFSCAVIFAYLPFYTIYGLGVAGVPLAILAFIMLSDEHPRVIPAYLLLIAYGLFSSLALMGWAVFLLGGLYCLIITVRKKKAGASGVLALWGGELVLWITYLVTNISMVESFFLGVGEESQRSEFVNYGAGAFPLSVFTEQLLNEDVNFWARACQKWVVLIMIATLILGLFCYRRLSESGKEKYRTLLGLAAFFVLTALFTALFRCDLVTALRNRWDNALTSFQFDRFFYLYPALWYIGLAVSLDLVADLFKAFLPKQRWVSAVIVLCLLGVCSLHVLWRSPFKLNFRDLVKLEGSTSLSWKGYYEPDQFREVADFIWDEYGLEQDQYRVGNLGLEPAVAITNGFYTIDGYSSVYSLSYKHKFRKVIEKELEKNEYNRQYFDEWGNRCYLFSSEYYIVPYLSKYTHPHFDDLELNVLALKDLGCRFLLATGEIADAESKGYRLVRIFDSYEYSYFIYLYEIL